MRRRTLLVSLTIVFLANALASCEAFRQKTVEEPINDAEKKTLTRPTLPPDSAVFDVLLTRIPYQDRDLARDFWNDVDEMEIDAATRTRLNEQGFRVGLIGASPPESLSKLLSLKGRELRDSLEEEVDYSKPETTNAPITNSKPVTLRVGMKSMIETRNEVCPSIPILENENGSLVGKTYADARTTLSVSIEQNLDGSVSFNIAPILKYGVPQLTTRYQHGQLVRVQEQPTKSFEQLKFSTPLRPGQFLVLGATDANTDALGKYFFSDGGEDFDQKILVIRLLVTQCDGQFDRFPDFKTLAERTTRDTESDEESNYCLEENGKPDFNDYELKTTSEEGGENFEFETELWEDDASERRE